MFTKRISRLSICAVALAIVGVLASGVWAADEGAAAENEAPKIQVAILLDTSGSMSGLINQARTQLWKIVNEFATTSRDGKQPRLEVALFEYGQTPLGEETGYMRMIVPLTDDLDKVSEELFKLTTNGGDEYCGMVIDKAVRELKWSNSSRDLKCIFIAGNEPFTQGPVDFRKACHDAANINVTVSTIHCGPYDEGVQGSWLEGSKLADGSYTNIDQNQTVRHIDAPQDKLLTELSSKLNTTYVAYGNERDRGEALERQAAQDTNAANQNQAVAAMRAQTKCSNLYTNARWDLCDALTNKVVKLEELKEDQLPEAMRKMTLEERKAYVEKKRKEREDIVAKMQELSKARDAYVSAELKKLAETGENTLDQAILEAVRVQAAQKEFKFAN